MLDHDIVLKNNELYLVGDSTTDGSRELATGLYARDTRHLSRFALLLNGAKPETLAVRVEDGARAVVVQSNSSLDLVGGELLFRQKLLIEQSVSLDDALQHELIVQNFHGATVQLEVAVEIAADFRDLFDIRGFPRTGRGEARLAGIEARRLVLGYAGRDGLVAETELTFSHEAVIEPAEFDTVTGEPSTHAPIDSRTGFAPPPRNQRGAIARFAVSLQPGERWPLSTTIRPKPTYGEPFASSSATTHTAMPRVYTDNEALNRVVGQCLRDLDLLWTRFPHGEMPAAGIPWFVAPFGRDSLIVGLQTLFLAPERATATLRTLAALQGSKVDAQREEEPGKIPHEMRYGEMARLGEVPHTPYFGTVDATPLFVWLFAETVIWTGDGALYAELLPHAKRALTWIEQFGDIDGDGLVEYRTDRLGVGRITHQVWKDSWDSLHHCDGAPAQGPVAAVEVQGYAFAAYARLAEAAALEGDESFAAELRGKADRVRAATENAFWMPDSGYYAQALDGEKRQVQAITSNPGHLLAARLPSPDRAAITAERMMQEDLDSGWGVRTLSSQTASYNPLSYHNGSVWPHDNSLLAAGLFAYGHVDAGNRILRALFDAAMTDPLLRLPELSCGVSRKGEAGETPIPYPVTCRPQAWAAGSIPFLLCAALGLEIDSRSRDLRINPMFPDWFSVIEIDPLPVRGKRTRLVITAESGGENHKIEPALLPGS